jgi:hypothetical protein
MAKVSLAARVQQLEALLAAAGVNGPKVQAVERIADAVLGAVPAGQILPHGDDGSNPIATAAGRAPVVPTPVLAGNVPADLTLESLAAAVGAIEAKLNALIAATGMGGSAAMAAHP